MLQQPSTIQSPTAAEWLALGLISIITVCVYGWIPAGGVGLIGFSDSVDYLLFTDFYRSQFAGEAPPEAVEFYRATRFPPLFPLLLASFGGGTDALQWTQVVAFAITLLMFAMLWAWLRRETENPVAAATITLLVVLSPGMFLLVLNPVSEPLAMGMTWLTFFLAAKPRMTTDRYILLALIAGMSTLARSANIALLVAIPVWLYLQRATWKQWVSSTAAAFAPFAFWLVYRRSIPRSDFYLDGLTLQYFVAELGGWPDLLYVHPWRLISGFASNLNTLNVLTLCIANTILVCATYGWWQRLWAKKLDAVFFAFYLGLILVWPFPTEAMRFMTFLLPLLFLYALLGVQKLTQAFPASTPSNAVAPALLALMFVLASASAISHFLYLATQTVDEELRGEQRTRIYFNTPDRASALKAAEGNARIRLTARETTRLLPPDDCVYATMPHLLQVHGPVKVVLYPKQFAEGVPIETQLRLCNYFFISGLKGYYPSHRPFYPSDDLDAWTAPVLMSEVGDHLLIAALLVRESGTAPVPDDSLKEQDLP